MEDFSDWADDAIRKLRQKIDDRRLETERFVEEQRIKRAHGVPLWNQVKDRLRHHVQQLKERSGGTDVVVIQNEQPDEIAIRNEIGGGTVLHVTFDSGRGAVTWECGQKPQRGWQINIAGNGTAEFVWGILIPTTPDAMATQMLDKLLEL
jgi:hypothetical protein